MRLVRSFVYVSLAVLLHAQVSHTQLPPRLAIPGAILLPSPGGRQPQLRQHRIQAGEGGPPPQRLRRPIPHAVPVPIRPVVEEEEDFRPTQATRLSTPFDDEVAKFGISALQSAVSQAVEPEEEPPRPVQFRPERPVPVLRGDIREGPPPPSPTQSLRQHDRENIPRPLLRQEPREENIPVPRPQPIRHTQPRQQIPVQPPPQQFRQAPVRANPPPARQPSQFIDDEDRNGRTRKPPVQILRKYRTDNADGSITWGYENEDGSFKEETLGIDCVTRGKYGYVDPDGVRREYSYETGNKCDPNRNEELEDDEVLPSVARQPQPQARKSQPQFRPSPAQY